MSSNLRKRPMPQSGRNRVTYSFSSLYEAVKALDTPSSRKGTVELAVLIRHVIGLLQVCGYMRVQKNR